MKKNIFLAVKDYGKYGFLSSLLLFSGNLLAQDITGGLILHYNFDQLTTASYNVADLSGSGYTADIQGKFAIEGGHTGTPADKSIKFLTARTPTSDYLQLPDNITSGLTDFSIAAWVKLDNVNNWIRIFDFGAGTSTNMFLTPNSGSGTVRFAIKLNDATGEQIVDGRSALPTGKWVHVVVAGDYSVNTVRLYVNGMLYGENTAVTTTPASLGASLPQNYIGKSQYVSDAPLLGCVDDFRIYNRALSQIDIYKLYGYSDEEIANMPKNGDGKLFTYLNTFTLNSKNLAFCSNEKLYYYSLPLSQIEEKVTLTLAFEKKNPDDILKIDGQEVSSNVSFTFKVDSAKRHKLEILQNDSVIATEYIIFTGLPIVQLYTTGNNLSTSFSRGQIRVHDTWKSTPYELLNMEIRYRGAITLNYQKKSFAVKIKDSSGENLDRSYFGLRDDQYWILDAMPIDKGRMRNKVSTDLWNDFSAAPYYKSEEPKMINGTRGQFVEVFLDDRYWGLYCMTERIDRKQLKLKKFNETTRQIHGVLYKASDWSYSVMMGYVPWTGPDPNYNIPNYSNSSETWERYEMQYPDMVDGEPIDWKPLYDVVSFVAKSSDADFINNIGKYIDLPVWLDYYLMMEMILAVDNHGKNCYVYMYDIAGNRILDIAPWDMDATLGRRWNASAVGASQNYPQYTINNEYGEHNLFRRLRETNALGFNDLLKKRYDELRFSYFAPKNLFKRLEEYKNMFDKSGAADRETKRWGGTNGITLDFDSELAYLRDWISTRSAYLNEQYGEPLLSVEENKLAGYSFYPNPVSGTLYVTNVEPGTLIRIYTLQGVPVYSGKADGTHISIDFSDYASGGYFLKIGESRGKVIMKQ